MKRLILFFSLCIVFLNAVAKVHQYFHPYKLKKWGITPRQVRNYCAHGRIYGATLERGEWRIPADAAKPERKSRRPFPTTVLGAIARKQVYCVDNGARAGIIWYNMRDETNACQQAGRRLFFTPAPFDAGAE